MREFDEKSITQAVLGRMSDCDDPRFRKVMTVEGTWADRPEEDELIDQENRRYAPLAMMLRAPSARGPYSIRPQKIAPTLPACSRPAVCSAGAPVSRSAIWRCLNSCAS